MAEAVIAGLAAVATTVNQVEGNRGARRGRKRQEAAQQRSETAARSQRRDARAADAKARRQAPDVEAMLAGMQSASAGGVGSTVLGGGSNGLQLGKTRLGE